MLYACSAPLQEARKQHRLSMRLSSLACAFGICASRVRAGVYLFVVSAHIFSRVLFLSRVGVCIYLFYAPASKCLCVRVCVCVCVCVASIPP